MTRAGREPAEDVKRRLVAACQEVGLVVKSATMHLHKDLGSRLVHADASLPEWPHEIGMLSVMAVVGVDGSWPETVDIRCIASRENPTTVFGPWMQGRGRVPFGDLIKELQATLAERKQVMAMAACGLVINRKGAKDRRRDRRSHDLVTSKRRRRPVSARPRRPPHRERRAKGSVALADGRLYYRTENGTMLLVA